MSILGVQPICCCRHSSTFFVMLLGGIVGFYFNGLVWLGDFVCGDYIIDFVHVEVLVILSPQTCSLDQNQTFLRKYNFY